MYGLGLLLDNTAYRKNKWICISCDYDTKPIILFALDVSDNFNFLRRVGIQGRFGYSSYLTVVRTVREVFGDADSNLDDVV